MVISIPCVNGYRIVAERNQDKEFDKELFIYVLDADGNIVQDLAIVRPCYHYGENDDVVWEDKFQVLVYGDAYNEDYTSDFIIERYGVE